MNPCVTVLLMAGMLAKINDSPFPRRPHWNPLKDFEDVWTRGQFMVHTLPSSLRPTFTTEWIYSICKTSCHQQLISFQQCSREVCQSPVIKHIGLYQGHISVHSFTFCVRMSVCSLVFAGVRLCVRMRLRGGKRSSGVCCGSVCVLTLADGWCVCECVCICVWAVGTAGG